MKYKYVVLIVLFTAFYYQLHSTETGGMAGSFLRYGLDARGEALGRSLVADFGNNNQSYYYNPALLSNISHKNIFINYRSLSFDRRFMYFGGSIPLKSKAALAMGVLHTGTEDFLGIDSSGDIYDSFSYYENMFHLTFSLKIKENIKIGLNGKFLYCVYPKLSDNGENVVSSSIALDFGGSYNFEKSILKGLVLGFVIRDLKGKNSWTGKKVWLKGQNYEDKYPKTFELGLGYGYEFKDFNFITNIALENKEKENYLKGGLEIIYVKNDLKFILRNGLNNGLFTTGIGFGLKCFSYYTMFDLSVGLNDISETVPVTLSWNLNI